MFMCARCDDTSFTYALGSTHTRTLSLSLSLNTPRREKQEQMLKQVNESTLNRLTAGQNGAGGREEAAKGRLVSQVGEGRKSERE